MPRPSEGLMTSASQQHRKRNLLRCAKCRADKQKCEPVTRDWDTSRERCRRCLKLDHACGPPQRAERTKRKRRSLLVDKGCQPLEEQDTDYSKPVHFECWDDDSSEEACPSRSDLTNCSSLTCSARESSLAGSERCLYGSTLTTATSVTSEHEVNQTFSIRRFLVTLQDHLSIINLLRFDQQLCHKVKLWTSADLDASFQDHIASIIDMLKKCTTRYLQQAEKLIHQHFGPDKELFLERLCSITEKYLDIICPQEPRSYGQRSRSQHPRLILVNRDRRTLYEAQRKSGPASTLYYLFGQTVDILTTCPLVHAGNDSDLVEDHLTASRAVKDVLFFLGEDHAQPVLSGRPSISRPPSFTACHLAALQTSPTVLLDLWQQCNCVWEVDFLKRTPVHMAAYAANLTVLKLIIEMDPTTVANVELDDFKMSPLMIAACKDDLEGCELLLKNGADAKITHKGSRSLLALAARNGSKKVVGYLLARPNTIPFSPISPLSEAILAGHEDVVVLFIEHFRRSFVDLNDVEIRAAIGKAKSKGFHNLVSQLEDLMKWRPDPQFAVQAISHLSSQFQAPSASSSWFETKELDCNLDAAFCGQSFTPWFGTDVVSDSLLTDGDWVEL